MNSKILVPEINEYQESLLEECIKDISYDDKDALSTLYNLTKTSVYGFALSILKNIHEAEDVLQEVYIRIYENASFYNPNGKPLAWILTITKNLALMKLRKNRNHLDLDELHEILADHKDVNEAENQVLLATVFEHISDEERNILILHAVSGFKHREIAKMLEIPLTTVLSKYNRKIKKIKKRMGEVKIWKRVKLNQD